VGVILIDFAIDKFRRTFKIKLETQKPVSHKHLLTFIFTISFLSDNFSLLPL